MRKRKYARFGEAYTKLECTKYNCKWQGTESELKGKIDGAGWTEGVCPKCSNNNFHCLI